MNPECHFVVDGRERAAEAIRDEVTAEFAEKLAATTFWNRWRVRRKIEAEVKRRMDKQSPGHALYAVPHSAD